MIIMRAYIQFEKPVKQHSNKKLKQENTLILNLDDFHLGSWTDFREKYDFKKTFPFAVDTKCVVSVEELYALLGSSYSDAVSIIKENNLTLSVNEILKEPSSINFYNELKTNDIYKVTLAILEVHS